MNLLVVPTALGDALSATECQERIEESLASVGVYASSHAFSPGAHGLIDALMAHGPLELHGVEISVSPGSHRFASAARRRGTWWIEGSACTENPTSLGFKAYSESTTYGLGELIKFCAQRHAAPMIVGIPDRFAPDGGLGMLMGMGLTASDAWGRPLRTQGGAADLAQVRHIHGAPLSAVGPMRILVSPARSIDTALNSFRTLPAEALEHIDALRRWTDTLNAWRQTHRLPEINPSLPSLGSGSGSAAALAALGGVITDGAQYFSRVTSLMAALQRADAAVLFHDGSEGVPLPEAAQLTRARLGLEPPCPVFTVMFGTDSARSEDDAIHLGGLTPAAFLDVAKRLRDKARYALR